MVAPLRVEYGLSYQTREERFYLMPWKGTKGRFCRNRPFSTVVDHSGFVRCWPILMKIYVQGLFDAQNTIG